MTYDLLLVIIESGLDHVVYQAGLCRHEMHLALTEPTDVCEDAFIGALIGLECPVACIVTIGVCRISSFLEYALLHLFTCVGTAVAFNQCLCFVSNRRARLFKVSVICHTRTTADQAATFVSDLMRSLENRQLAPTWSFASPSFTEVYL